MGWMIAVVVLLAGACGCGEGVVRDGAISEPMETPIRMSMAALHAAGGTPPGWQLAPARGDAARGRQVFADQGCHSCHLIAGESFPGGTEDEAVGPELTGMGAHHPPGYFVEAILSPSAVLIEGEGWITESGRSAMPAYPDMTIADLTDVVAYLSSLTTGGMHDHAAMMAAKAVSSLRVPRPAPPAGAATRFFVQRYDVLPGRLEDFEAWFAREGKAAFLSFDGVVDVDTYVHHGRPGMTTIIAFRDDPSVRAFLNDPRSEALGEAFDAFIGPHGHQTFIVPPIYRAATLSTRGDAAR